MIALDSSILVDLDRGNRNTQTKLREILRTLEGAPALPFISYAEFVYGTLGRAKQTSLQLDKLIFLTPTRRTAEIVAKLKLEQETKGKPLPLADIMIAAQAREHNLTLVTKDSDFLGIEGIKVKIIT
ncbi:MAG: PIN domain-containing protein [Candidatus Woesearchaeota archaeon]